ncbi:MAG: amidohydrolase [Bacteroidales bacterium]|nr:amidohydrolase [Bacteroidales bacterium]
MKHIMSIMAMVSSLAVLSGCKAKTAATIFENGVIYTVDKTNPNAEAMAVDTEGKLLCVGTKAEVEAYKGDKTKVVDLGGKFVMPAFGEDHCHIFPADIMCEVFFAHRSDENNAKLFIKDVNARHPENGGKMSYTDCVYAELIDYAKAHPETKIIRAFGYCPSFLEGSDKEVGAIQKYRLDELGEDGPAFLVYSFSGHDVSLNSKAMAMCGIDRNTPTPYGGVIDKDANGEPTGSFHDAALAIADLPLDVEKQIAGLEFFQKQYNAAGIVNVQNVSANGYMPCPLEGAWRLANENKLTIRLRSASGITLAKTRENIDQAYKDHAKYQSEMFAVNTAKFFVDGAFYTLADWPSKPGYHGSCCWGDDEYKEFMDAVEELHKNGIQCHFHVYADRAAKLTMDAIENACLKYPGKDLRHTLAHIMTIRPEDIVRMGKYKCVAAMQPSWFVSEGADRQEYLRSMIGDQIKTMYPYKSMIDAGAIVGGGTDYPVSDAYKPLEGIQIGYTRNNLAVKDINDPKSLLWPEERVTLEQILEAYTLNVAKEMFCEDITGSLEKGKFADFVVLGENLFEIDPVTISKVPVLATYLKGGKIFDANE